MMCAVCANVHCTEIDPQCLANNIWWWNVNAALPLPFSVQGSISVRQARCTQASCGSQAPGHSLSEGVLPATPQYDVQAARHQPCHQRHIRPAGVPCLQAGRACLGLKLLPAVVVEEEAVHRILIPLYCLVTLNRALHLVPAAGGEKHVQGAGSHTSRESGGHQVNTMRRDKAADCSSGVHGQAPEAPLR